VVCVTFWARPLPYRERHARHFVSTLGADLAARIPTVHYDATRLDRRHIADESVTPSIHLAINFVALALPHQTWFVSALAEASDPGFVHAEIPCCFQEFFHRPSHGDAQNPGPPRRLVEPQDVDERWDMRQMMKTLHRIPITGIEGLVRIPVVLFDENILFDIPAMTRHTMAPFQPMDPSERLFGHQGPKALMVSVGIDPGFDALHEMEHGLWPLIGFRIFPFVGHVMGPPHRMRSVSPPSRHGVFGLEFVRAPRIVLPGRQIPLFENDHKIPSVRPEHGKQRPIRIQAIGQNGESQLRKELLQPFRQPAEGFEFRTLLGCFG